MSPLGPAPQALENGMVILGKGHFTHHMKELAHRLPWNLLEHVRLPRSGPRATFYVDAIVKSAAEISI
jgi:hypothetical protein